MISGQIFRNSLKDISAPCPIHNVCWKPHVSTGYITNRWSLPCSDRSLAGSPDVATTRSAETPLRDVISVPFHPWIDGFHFRIRPILMTEYHSPRLPSSVPDCPKLLGTTRCTGPRFLAIEPLLWFPDFCRRIPVFFESYIGRVGASRPKTRALAGSKFVGALQLG